MRDATVMPAIDSTFIFVLSPATSSSMASQASSVVTMPSRVPCSSTTGMAGMSYLKMSAATSSSSSEGRQLMMSSYMMSPMRRSALYSTSVRREFTPSSLPYSSVMYT